METIMVGGGNRGSGAHVPVPDSLARRYGLEIPTLHGMQHRKPDRITRGIPMTLGSSVQLYRSVHLRL